jgi:hypothetical protein
MKIILNTGLQNQELQKNVMVERANGIIKDNTLKINEYNNADKR